MLVRSWFCYGIWCCLSKIKVQLATAVVFPLILNVRESLVATISITDTKLPVQRAQALFYAHSRGANSVVVTIAGDHNAVRASVVTSCTIKRWQFSRHSALILQLFLRYFHQGV